MQDPTAVMGRRIGAYFIDLGLGLVVFVVMFFAMSTTDDSGFGCDVVTHGESVQMCFSSGDSIRYAVGGDAMAIYGVTLGVWLLNAVVLQGATGATLGKHLTGLRVVKRDGSMLGIGKAIGRWFFFIADNQPCGVPIVGLVTSLASKGHRRVGDMVMGTYVIGKADAGRPVVLPGEGGSVGGPTGYGQPPGGYGQPPAGYGQPPASSSWQGPAGGPPPTPPAPGGGFAPPPPPPPAG